MPDSLPVICGGKRGYDKPRVIHVIWRHDASELRRVYKFSTAWTVAVLGFLRNNAMYDLKRV